MTKSRLRFLSQILILSAVLTCVAGAYQFWRQQQDNQHVSTVTSERQKRANQGHATGDNPSTIKPDDGAFERHQAAADLPRYISIPKIGVKAAVHQVGLAKDGDVGAPTNVHNAAWYTGSAKPGNAGAMLIDGHVSSWTTAGVFHELRELKQGDMINVERGDGTTFDYKVVTTQVYKYDAVDMNKVLAPIDPARPGLNLITCSGQVVDGTNDFSRRLVVFASQQ